MSKKAFLAAGAILLCTPVISAADEVGTEACVDVAGPRQAVESRNGKWIELSSEQWEFLRGIYAMNPDTPPGLPFGDKAVLVEFDGIASGLIFFVDGNKACTPMQAPPQLMALIQEVAIGKISHQGQGT